MPFASRLSFASAWSCEKSRNRRTAMSVVTRPARLIPARNTSGSRTRSEPRAVISDAPQLLVRRFLLRVLRRRDLVADTPHGDDRRRITELPPQLADMDVDGASVTRERVAPHTLEQLVARQHEPAMVEQLPQQIEFLRCELNLLFADTHLTATGVDVEVAVLDRLALEIAAVGRRAAQDRLHARDELPRVEGLRQIVVGTDLEADDLVDVLVARGQHQDRHVARLANALRHLDAVDVRKHEVEHDQSGHLLRDLVQRITAGRGRADGVPGVLEVQRDERGDRALVLDHEDARRRSAHYG